jgi:hypothetical protein
MDDDKFERAEVALNEHGKFHPEPSQTFQRRVLQRIETDPCAVLAGDLLEMLVSQGDTPHSFLEGMARSCREAAEICYGKPPLFQVDVEEGGSLSIRPLGGVDPGAESGDLGPMTAEQAVDRYCMGRPASPLDIEEARRTGSPLTGGVFNAEKGGE